MIQFQNVELVPTTLEGVLMKIHRIKSFLAWYKTGQALYEEDEVPDTFEYAMKIHNHLVIEAAEVLQIRPNPANASLHEPIGGNSQFAQQAVQSDPNLSVKSQLKQGSLIKYCQVLSSQEDVIHQHQSLVAVIGNQAPENPTESMQPQHLQQDNPQNQAICDLCCIQ